MRWAAARGAAVPRAAGSRWLPRGCAQLAEAPAACAARGAPAPPTAPLPRRLPRRPPRAAPGPLQPRGTVVWPSAPGLRRAAAAQGRALGGGAWAAGGGGGSAPSGGGAGGGAGASHGAGRARSRLRSYDDPEGLVDFVEGAAEDAAQAEELLAALDAIITAAGAVQTSPGEERLLDLPGFERLCLNVLNFRLARSEIGDIFASVDSDGDGLVCARNFLEQCHSGRHHAMLFSMVHLSRVHELNKDYVIPPGYDFSRPTNDPEANHGCRERRFVGRFRNVREQLDFGYHGGYTQPRQEWQDAVMSTMMLRSEPKEMPWLVYTCGGYGTGKGFCMAWMSEHGLFPMSDMVCVDPDQFKQAMPEWKHYVHLGKDAGTLCHAESAYMEELAQALAMRNRQNVWIDGSLWNTQWHKGVLQDLKDRYPHYRVALFHIFATEARARARIEARRAASGRGIPPEKVAQSLDGAWRSAAELTPHVDVVVRIDNDGEVPILRSVGVVDRSGSWESIARRFAWPVPRKEDFPLALAPLRLRALPSDAVQAMKAAQDGRKVLLDLAALCGRAGPDVLPAPTGRLLRAILPGVVELEASPAFPVPRDVDVQRMANVPISSQAESCFVYQRQTADEGDPLRTQAFIRASSYRAAEGFPAVVELLKYGGFVYIDAASGAVIAATCLSKRPGTGVLPFGAREPLSAELRGALAAQGRWRPVTLSRLKVARQYAWVCPREIVAGQRLGGLYGAMAFVLEDDSAWLFQVSPFTPEPPRQPGSRARAGARTDARGGAPPAAPTSVP